MEKKSVRIRVDRQDERVEAMRIFGWSLVEVEPLRVKMPSKVRRRSPEKVRLRFVRDLNIADLDGLRIAENEYWSLYRPPRDKYDSLAVLLLIVIPSICWMIIVQFDVFAMVLFFWCMALVWTLIADKAEEEEERIENRREEIAAKARKLLSERLEESQPLGPVD